MSDAAFPRGSLRFLLGIEDTSVKPPARFGMADLDEHELTDHAVRWREDLTAVRDLGATGLRYGVGWPAVHLAPGVFDWSSLDERLGCAAGDLGLTVVADLVHYGTPTWLDDAFADPRYPEAVAEFTAAFAERYRGLVDCITPLNEPLTTASFCGLRGVWPPALTGWAGWTEVVVGIVEGVRRSIAAARAVNPDLVVVHVEAGALYLGDGPDVREHAALLRRVADLPTDLLTGRVDTAHPMHAWLIEQGASGADLERFRADPPAIDVLGVNYYPDLTPRTLVPRDGSVEQVATDLWDDGLRRVLVHMADRHGLPVALTETSVEGDGARRAAWLEASVRAVRELCGSGMDLRGYTWWPLTDFVDWSYASGGRNVEEFLLDRGAPGQRAADQRFGDPRQGRSAFLRRMGLLALEESGDGLVRRPTAASSAYRDAVDLDRAR